MIYEGQECKINDYIKQINDFIKKVKDINEELNDFLEDHKYVHCEICKINFNEYFCDTCKKNICKICTNNHNEAEKHILINLDEMKETYKNNIKFIKTILNRNIIPFKEGENIQIIGKLIENNEKIDGNNDDSINDNCQINKNEENNYKDILLII